LRIIVDAFGGDNAPLEILKGCALAVKEEGISVLLAGEPDEIKRCAAENGIGLDGIEILPAPGKLLMTDHAGDILKEKSDSSMAVGLKALAAGEGAAFVSAGSTGALVMGATFLVKRIPGIRRAAIASVLPTNAGPLLLLDCGANADCTPEFLLQFAFMGGIYAQKVLRIASPRVSLVNIGTEETKGGKLQTAAYALMKQEDPLFTGNIEAREIPFGGCDVAVTDGFTGNIVLKMYEGVASALMANIKAIYKKNIVTTLSALAVKGGLTDLKKRMDYTEFGGAPLLGTAAPVIKAHGASDAKAVKNAVKQARDFAACGAIEEIAARAARNGSQTPGGQE